MSIADLESIACPLCRSQGGSALAAGGKELPYRVILCAACGFEYLSPRLTEAAMQAAYAADTYFSGGADGYADYAAQEMALRATFRRLLQTLSNQGRAGGSLLEVGCGYGYLLDEARPYFSRRVGTDFSPEAVRIASEQADAVHRGGVAAVPAGERFDLVISTHVIEHVYHPREFVAALMDRLKPSGTLLLATPDAGSFWRKLMGRRWPSFKFPEHVLYFNRNTLARLLSECGLAELRIVSYPHAFPLPLVATKLGLSIPSALSRFCLWLPATTIAIAGVKKND